MRSPIAFATLAACLLATCASAQTFNLLPTSGNVAWNVDGNWDMPGFPDAIGAGAILPAPSGDLSIDLGEEITIESLTINKSTTGTFNTTLTGTATNKLIIAGDLGETTLINASSTATGGGVTTLAAPIEFADTFTVTQRDDGILQFAEPLSGAGGLTINRAFADSGVITGVVELNAANTYAGTTTFQGQGSGNARFLIVRLNHADAIPADSPIILSDSAVLELAAGDFTRSVGTGAGQISFTSANFSGWSAVGGDRIVNLGNQPMPAQVSWATAGFGQLTLGVVSSTHMVDFQNPIDLGTGTGTRTLRSEDGTGDIDGRISGSITSATRGIIKAGSGILSLAAENTYAGSTTIQGGMLRLDHASALPSGNLVLGSGGVLGLGAGNFARDLGTGTNQVQFIFSGGNGNAGFSAHGENRTVVLNGGAPLTWALNNFVIGNLIFSDDSADSMVDFQNDIDLNGAARTVPTRQGSADIDGRLSGIISGTGSLIKSSPGTLELTNANTYDGGTTIDGGRLLVNNTSDSGTGTGGVTVNNGTLGGDGAIAGIVTVNTGAHVAPGMSIGSLEVGGLTLNAGAVLDFELDTILGVDTSDLIDVTNTDGLTINGGSVVLTNAGAMTEGTYTLIEYAGTIMGTDVATFLSTTPTGPAGFTYSLVDNTADTSIDLVVMAAAGVAGDFNSDGVVDSADYAVWRANDGPNNPLPNDNGLTTQQDRYNLWVANFGQMAGSGSSGSLAAPEPGSIVLLLFAAPLIFRPVRRSR
jgi:autotransporter-associated beta strand protein